MTDRFLRLRFQVVLALCAVLALVSLHEASELRREVARITPERARLPPIHFRSNALVRGVRFVARFVLLVVFRSHDNLLFQPSSPHAVSSDRMHVQAERVFGDETTHLALVLGLVFCSAVQHTGGSVDGFNHEVYDFRPRRFDREFKWLRFSFLGFLRDGLFCVTVLQHAVPLQATLGQRLVAAHFTHRASHHTQ